MNKDMARLKLLLTNARSLAPKIHSLHDTFEEHEIDIALITESWLKDGVTLNNDVIDLEYGSGLKIIYKNRPKKNVGTRSVGGGVSIVFNKARCSLRERKMAGNKFELVAAVGRVGNVKRQVVAFCVYIEPKMKAAEFAQLSELLRSEILKLKVKGDPIVILGGDLNHRDLSDALGDFIDITRQNYDPTPDRIFLEGLMSNC